MITMYEPDGEPSGAAASADLGTGPVAPAAAQPTAAAVHDVELAPGTSRAEFVGTMLDRVPAQARFVEAYGDVDLTMRWRTDDRCVLDLLVSSEATAWRTWRDAERRARDFARLHRRAADSAHTAHSAWKRAVYDLVEQHPSFRDLGDATGRAVAGGTLDADREQARHAAPGDPPTRRVASRTEAAAQAMLRRRTDRARGRDRDAAQPESEPDLPRRLVGQDVDGAGLLEATVDPDRDGYEAAVEAWHAAADGDGLDVPLHPGEEVEEVVEVSLDRRGEADGRAEAKAEPDGGQ